MLQGPNPTPDAAAAARMRSELLDLARALHHRQPPGSTLLHPTAASWTTATEHLRVANDLIASHYGPDGQHRTPAADTLSAAKVRRGALLRSADLTALLRLLAILDIPGVSPARSQTLRQVAGRLDLAAAPLWSGAAERGAALNALTGIAPPGPTTRQHRGLFAPALNALDTIVQRTYDQAQRRRRHQPERLPRHRSAHRDAPPQRRPPHQHHRQARIHRSNQRTRWCGASLARRRPGLGHHDPADPRQQRHGYNRPHGRHLRQGRLRRSPRIEPSARSRLD